MRNIKNLINRGYIKFPSRNFLHIILFFLEKKNNYFSLKKFHVIQQFMLCLISNDYFLKLTFN